MNNFRSPVGIPRVFYRHIVDVAAPSASVLRFLFISPTNHIP
jgi:hypothetical protein